MSAAHNSSVIIDLERSILRVLCRDLSGGSTSHSPKARSRHRAVSALLSYHWQDAEHRIVFEALARLPGRDGGELRCQLPAQATRMGFPDVRWETYFANDAPQSTQAPNEHGCDLAVLIAQLLAASSKAAS